MGSWSERLRRFALVPLLAVAALVLLPRLGERSIVHSDEGHYIGAALTALETGDWVVPRVDGEFNRDYGKPPLGHLLIAAPAALLGPEKTSFRSPFVLAALLTLGCIVALGDRLAPGAGLLAAALLVASAGFAENVRRIWLETLVVSFDLAAILAYCHGRRRGDWRWQAAAVPLFSFALLTKQLPGGFGLAAILVAEIMTPPRRWKRLLVLFAASIAPLVIWGALLSERVGSEWQSIWSFHVFRGVIEGHANQPRAPGDYLFSLATLLGWGALCAGVVGLAMLLRRVRQRHDPERFLIVALLAYLALSVLIIGVASRSFRFWYPFPAGHVVAIAAGVAASAAIRAGAAWWACAALVSSFALLESRAAEPVGAADKAVTAVLAAIFLAAAVYAARRRPTGDPPPKSRWLLGAALAAVLLAGTIGSFWQNVVAAPADAVENMMSAIREASPSVVVAEPRYFHEEFLYYARSLPLRRAARGHACGQPPPGQRWAYLALDRRPPCWQELRGAGGRVQNHHWFITSLD